MTDRIAWAALVLFALLPGLARADRVYWVELDFGEIQRINLDGTGFEDVLGPEDGIDRPHSVALDTLRGKLYVTDGNRIWRADLDGSNLENPVWASGIFGGIAVDSVGGKVYWCSLLAGKIHRADLDGTNVEEIVIGLDRPEFVTLDLAAGKIYWTDRDAGKIQRAKLDGTGVEDLVEGLGLVSGIALDVVAATMYWGDVTSDGIHRAGIEIPAGETPSTRTDIEQVVFSADAPLGVALDVGRGHLYWIAQNALEVRRADLEGSNETVVTPTDDGVPNSLALEFAAPGRVDTLRVGKSSVTPGALVLSWLPSCTHGAADYGIYEGLLGNWYSHVAVDCSDDGGDLREDVIPMEGDGYYLVVPVNFNGEGSYGTDSDTERPTGTPACVSSQFLAPCP